jgi:Ca2+ transporting ATPase
VINLYASQSLRTISFAYKDLKAGEGGEKHDNINDGEYLYEIEKSGYTLIGIIGIKDVIRAEVPLAVGQCQGAGIIVRMVTGDNLITAKAIAKECGILNDELLTRPDSVMEGPEFYKRMGGIICRTCKKMAPCECNRKDVKEGVLNLEAFKALHKNLRVLARSRPEDKYLLVTGLKELGDVVAVTGDGTNDAPALKKADVGFAMGITGTEIAKHAAAIIIMDDNFASIVKACMWGRNIYDNIRKFLQFQITVSLVALFTAFIGSVVLKDSPLQPIQLLWVNLIIDSLAALALATEPPKIELLNRPPQSRDEYIISRKMLKQIVGMAFYMICIMYSICFAGEFFFPEPDLDYRFNRQDIPFVFPGRQYDWDGTPLFKEFEKVKGSSRQLSNVFNIFVVMAIFNILNARIINDDKNIFNGVFQNPVFCIVLVFIGAGQVIIV